MTSEFTSQITGTSEPTESRRGATCANAWRYLRRLLAQPGPARVWPGTAPLRRAAEVRSNPLEPAPGMPLAKARAAEDAFLPVLAKETRSEESHLVGSSPVRVVGPARLRRGARCGLGAAGLAVRAPPESGLTARARFDRRRCPSAERVSHRARLLSEQRAFTQRPELSVARRRCAARSVDVRRTHERSRLQAPAERRHRTVGPR